MTQLRNTDFMLEVVKGNVPGHSAINKFGHNPAVATGPEDIWSGGGIYAFYPATAQTMEVVSSDDEDGGAGTDTGALTMQIYGLDANWAEVDETITLNGTTVVAVTGHTYIRMYRAIVLTAGSHGTNVGNIAVRIASAGTTGAYIAADDGQTQQAIYTIPGGKTGYFTKGYTGVSDGGSSVSRESATFKQIMRPNNGTTGAWQVKGQVECINDGNTTWQYGYGMPAGPIEEKTDVRLECTTTSTELGVVGGFDIVLVDN